MSLVSGKRAFLEVLRQEGVDVIFGNPGTYNVVLKVTDSEGKVGTTTKSITIAAAPELP